MTFALQDPSPASTSVWTERLAHWIENNAESFVTNLLIALATLVVGLWVAKLISGFVRRLLVRSKVEDTLARFLTNLGYYALATLVVVASLERVGVKTASFIAILGAAGLAVGFALQGSLGNLASGVMIMLFRPFRVGDFVVAAGQEGAIEEIGVFATVMNTVDNRRVILPNSSVTAGAIINVTGNATRRVDLTLAVAGSEDIERVRAIVRLELSKIPQVLAEPAPEIAVLELGPATKLVVRPWCKTADYWSVFHAAQEGLKRAFERERVKAPVPRTEVVSVD